VYSVREPTPQKISTGRPSQPQRPPGSMHEVLPLGVMHLPWLRQPTVKPQRCWEGHSASVLQLTPGRESCVLEVPLIIVCAWLLPQVVLRHRTKSTADAKSKQIFLIALDRSLCLCLP